MSLVSPVLAATMTIWELLGIGALAVALGVAFIFAGVQNIKTQTAEETGRRRLVNDLFGNSNTYTGSKAVLQGRIKVACGVMMIVFGVAYPIVIPFFVK